MHAASSSTSVIAGSSQAGTAGPRGRAHGIGSRSRSGVRTPTRRLGRCHCFTLREARRHWADHARGGEREKGACARSPRAERLAGRRLPQPRPGPLCGIADAPAHRASASRLGAPAGRRLRAGVQRTCGGVRLRSHGVSCATSRAPRRGGRSVQPREAAAVHRRYRCTAGIGAAPLWRYRVVGWRIEDDVLRVLVLRIAHRREVYR